MLATQSGTERPRRPWWRWTLRACAAGVLLAFAVEASRVLFGRNLHVVVPGRIYRCAQPSCRDLDDLVRSLGIRTVINLRGACADLAWHERESRATGRLDLNQEDISLSSGRLPPVHEMRRLVEVLDHAEYPLVFHCRRGSDRTGLASAVALLLQTDADFNSARKQLGVRFGHFNLGRPANLDRFFDLYLDYLRQHGATHSRDAFRRWLTEEYCPGPCRCTVEPLDLPAACPLNEPVGLRVRMHNTSLEPWQLRQGNTAGFHAGFMIYDDKDRLLLTGRSGLFEAEVPPGEYIDITVILPPFRAPGTYRILLDMVDEQQCWFYQAGSEPLEREIVVSGQ